MAGLTVPSIADLALFQGVNEVTDLRAYNMLQQATDLMAMNVGFTEDPVDDEIGLRFLKNGILDMAWKLLVALDNREELYTPYTSERIGSYSYSKMVQAATRGEETGVPFFDTAVQYFANGSVDGSIMGVDSEPVFNADGRQQWEIELDDRLAYWGAEFL